ncbi:MAG: hypothetical protein AAGE01_00580 [Pseudomonadota bacterium]
MPRIILHAGMHKTGTSSIQATLHRADLSGSGFSYPDLGWENHSTPLSLIFREDPSRWHFVRRRGWTAAELAAERARCERRLEAALEAADGRTLVLSAEGIGGLGPRELEALAERLARYGTVEAIAYVRDPAGYAASSLQGLLRNGVTEFDAHLAKPIYRPRFETLERVLTREAVQYIAFDPPAFPGRCVVTDICGRMGLPLKPADIVRRNDSLTREANGLLYLYYRQFPDAGRPGRLIRRLRTLDGPPLRLAASLLAAPMRAIEDDIRWMASRVDVPVAPPQTDAAAIRSVDELAEVSDDSLRWVAAQLGVSYRLRWRAARDPAVAARWLRRLTALELPADP